MDGLTPGGETTTHHPTTIKCSIRALACELIDILDDSVKTSRKVAIDTDGGSSYYHPKRLVTPDWDNVRISLAFQGEVINLSQIAA
jgi:hypothetical protein